MPTEDTANSSTLDSWEDFDEGNIPTISEALAKLGIQTGKPKEVVDPFAVDKAKPVKVVEKAPVADVDTFDGFRHIIIASGSNLTDELMHKLFGDFGRNINICEINSTTFALSLPTTIEARHAARNSDKYFPFKIFTLEELKGEHLDFVKRNRDVLAQRTTKIRPPTNMSVIRQTVARHLNVVDPTSSEKRTKEKEQLRKAKEEKKAKAEIWE